MISTKDLLNIVATASNLYERMNSELYICSTPTDDDQKIIEKRLQRWQMLIADNDPDKFMRRIAWDGWDVDQIKHALGKVSYKKNELLPDWAIMIQFIIQYLAEFKSLDLSPIHIRRETLAFEDILLPLIGAARKKLLAQSKVNSTDELYCDIFTEDAYLDLEWSLLQTLSRLCADVLETEFNAVRPASDQLLSILLAENDFSPEASTIYYQQYIHQFLQKNAWITIFKKYPVLARLIAIAVEFWVESTLEFFHRVIADSLEIAATFSIDATEKIISLQSNMSDHHQRGRAVVIMMFTQGKKIVYKPKNLSIGVAYHQFLSWCNTNNAPLSFKITRILSKFCYGYEEFIQHLPCENAVEAKRFYQRAGMMLCTLYLLKATDCHFENVIAHGEHFVLIDSETLLTPTAMMTNNNFFLNSLLGTGLLPCWRISAKDQPAYDISGLGCFHEDQSVCTVLQWHLINTDKMYQKNVMVNLKNSNLPALNNVYLSPADYLPEIIDGFEKMYQFFMNVRDSLLNEAIDYFRDCAIRYVFRDTKTYLRTLIKSCQADYLRDGIDHSIEIDCLSRPFLKNQQRPDYWPILSAEIAALEQIDVPCFFTSPLILSLATNEWLLTKIFFMDTSYLTVRALIKNLNEYDMQQQISLIKSSFDAHLASPVTEAITNFSSDKAIIKEKLTSPRLLSYAEKMGDTIDRYAFLDKENHAHWIAPGHDCKNNIVTLQPVGNNLYDGAIGITLFLSALFYVTHKTKFRTLALAGLNPLLKSFRISDVSKQHIWADSLGIGGYTGISSVIYGLTLMSHFIQDHSLLKDASYLASFISPDRILQDQQLDIIGGSAGAILALLALFKSTQDKSILHIAELCGQHILKTWKEDAAKPLTGFAHGAAGIAYSLIQLYASTGQIKFLNAAKAAIVFEQSTYLSHEKNWPSFHNVDQHNTKTTRCMVSWCNGAPGILLARLAGLENFQDTSIWQDIQIALQTTELHLPTHQDHLCCGNFGRIEALWVAAHKLKDKKLKNRVERQVASLLLSKEHRDHAFRSSINKSIPVLIPGFLQGIAGIGYQFLRLIYPEKIPSVLMLEAIS